MTNPFDQRWQRLAQQARHLPDDAATELPWGFKTRVLAQLQQAPAEPWSEILTAVGFRAAAAIAAVFVASAGFAIAEWYEFRIEPPALEAAVRFELTSP